MRCVARLFLVIFFIAVGLGHFIYPSFLRAMMPPFIPWPDLWIALSGVLEITFGALVLSERTRRIACIGLIVILLGVFPANIYMAICSEQFPNFSPTVLWLRLPLQAVFIAWVWYACRSTQEE